MLQPMVMRISIMKRQMLVRREMMMAMFVIVASRENLCERTFSK